MKACGVKIEKVPLGVQPPLDVSGLEKAVNSIARPAACTNNSKCESSRQPRPRLHKAFPVIKAADRGPLQRSFKNLEEMGLRPSTEPALQMV